MNNGVLTRGGGIMAGIAESFWDYWPPSLTWDPRAARREAFARAIDQANRRRALEWRNFSGNF